jgi:acyl-CoA reductase-like NAD-dependent aldehyde dehydrogenase
MTPTSAGTLQVRDRLFVGGRFEPATSGRSLEVISPRSEELIARVELASEADVDRAVAAARDAFDHGEWPRLTPPERAAALRRVADGLEVRAHELVELAV